MSDETKDDGKPFDPFELATAVLLGLAAIGAALAGLQSGQWGGRQLEAFSASNALMTKAATQYNEDIVNVNADYAAVAAAKQHILEARDARDEQTRERNLDIASYLYMYQMTEVGYDAMALPKEYYVEDEDETEHAGAAAPGTAGPGVTASASGSATAASTAAGEDAAAEDEDEEEEVDPATVMSRDIPDETLLASLATELDDDYIDKALATGEKMFQEADAKFGEGKVANDNGDKFDLAGVYYTVALFFAGLGLIFKTKMRWGLFGLGSLFFVATTIYMATLPWAG